MYTYICLQCPTGSMTNAQARAHMNIEGHEVEQEDLEE